MLHPNPNMLLRIAQGDAYGVAAEYCNRHPDELEHRELFEFKRYVSHAIYAIAPGSYTDDTQMSIAVAETLINFKHNLHRGTFSTSFWNAFKRDPRPGYSPNFQRILESSSCWGDVAKRLHATSDKNGAAIRAVPIGVIADPKRVVEVATEQAKITHDSEGGISSAVAVALMSHFALYDRRDFSRLPAWCCQWQPSFTLFERPWSGPVQGQGRGKLGVGVVTAWATCTLLMECNSLLDIMRRILEWGGDTDTIAAIAWGIASARYRDEQLPEFFERDLEMHTNSPYGVKFLKRLGERLMEAYK